MAKYVEALNALCPNGDFLTFIQLIRSKRSEAREAIKLGFTNPNSMMPNAEYRNENDESESYLSLDPLGIIITTSSKTIASQPGLSDEPIAAQLIDINTAHQKFTHPPLFPFDSSKDSILGIKSNEPSLEQIQNSKKSQVTVISSPVIKMSNKECFDKDSKNVDELKYASLLPLPVNKFEAKSEEMLEERRHRQHLLETFNKEVRQTEK